MLAEPPVGILLAAGRGTRFDASGERDKLLALLPTGIPLAVAAANHLRAQLPRVIAVVRPDADVLAKMLRKTGCEVIVCPQADEGMGTVLACGVLHGANAAAWLVALADMPFIAATSYASVIVALDEHDLVAPEFAGQRGHPVGIARRYLSELLSLSGDVGARALFAKSKAHLIHTTDPGVIRDIDMACDL